MRKTFLEITSRFRYVAESLFQPFQPQLAPASMAEPLFGRLSASQTTSSLGNMSDLLQGIFYMGVPKSRVRIFIRFLFYYYYYSSLYSLFCFVY